MSERRRILYFILMAQAFTSLQGQAEELFNVDETLLWGQESANFGYLDLSSYPWINSVCLGWMYVHTESTRDNLYLWQEALGWIYTTSDSFPVAYLYRDMEWVLFDITNYAEVKYFSLTNNNWKNLKWIREYDEIPEHLRGIVALYQTHRIYRFSFGKFIMLKFFTTTFNMDLEPFAYDANTDEFYPTTRCHIAYPEGKLYFPFNFRYKFTIEGDRLIPWLINGWTGEVSQEYGDFIIQK